MYNFSCTLQLFASFSSLQYVDIGLMQVDVWKFTMEINAYMRSMHTCVQRIHA
eukprot:m.104903 g.104903  ORF g.104903 m.104903 type:complete len:53 (-) comp13267_c1_seq2:101-259(-)